MNKIAAVVGVLGAVALGWGGSSLSGHLGLSAWPPDVAIFALGCILLGQLPAIGDRARIQKLELELKALRDRAASSAS